ncbi:MULTISPECIES: serine/threonine-protein kinase [Actinoalloteichus]|uniref:non-specific serine/threonine protein kinase n=1 Tax=Actinoalloteichus fjordicus TaxID=1612552 RepID=A0AAC9LIS3_9PSEU|nr:MULTISPECIES: serine/threonine-protein kinase [Actinoalloteichus]APU17559.1 protein kinase family protein [Actinoalloteichus fjordicus]APU23637.1 protein kinase family protein [Actinoalloteichus sp. GBA129-24]
MSDEGRLVAGRYRLDRRIGSGAMGVVWQGTDDRLGRVVAIKQLLLQPGLSPAETEEARQRAMREGRIAARLQHQNAIAVYDVAEDDGQPCLIMEYLPSDSLATALTERGPLPPTEVARIGASVAGALAAAHAAGIVHRDIKPGNILLGHNGEVKITDFGISRATGDVTVTKTGMLAGTPAYLAPEVAKGYDPGFGADVFSLGATLYAAVEGEPPFGTHENTLALLHLVAAGRINPPRQAGPLTALLMRLLRAEPIERPTMAQAREGMQAVAAGRPAPGPPMPAGPPRPAAAHGAAAPKPAGGPTPTRLDARPVTDRPEQARTVSTAAQAPQGAHQPKPEPRPTRNEPEEGFRGRAVLLTAVAVIAAALIGVLIAGVFFTENNGAAGGAGAAGPSTSESAETTTEAPPSEEAPPVVDTPERSIPREEAPSVTEEDEDEQGEDEDEDSEQSRPERSEALVAQYFDLLPDNYQQAFNLLDSDFQGDFGGYESWWGDSVESVTITRGPDFRRGRVRVDLHFVRTDGVEVDERWDIHIEGEGDDLRIGKVDK